VTAMRTTELASLDEERTQLWCVSSACACVSIILIRNYGTTVTKQPVAFTSCLSTLHSKHANITAWRAPPRPASVVARDPARHAA
jgi:hypothetical protein